jgi:MFS family permease
VRRDFDRVGHIVEVAAGHRARPVPPAVVLAGLRRRPALLGGFTSVFFIFTLHLQSGLRYSALMVGLAITPFALGSAAGAAIGGRMVNRLGRPLVAIGLALVTVGFVATVVAVAVAVDIQPGRSVGWVTALPLLVAGIGSGFSISPPNQAITLSQVPTAGGGSVAGVLQTGQRVGSAVGIAAVGVVFFSSVASSGDFAKAFRTALIETTVFVVAALLLACLDVLGSRRRRHGVQHGPEHRWSAVH